MSNTIERVGQGISDLIGSVATTEDDGLISNALTNKVRLDVNMLCTLIDGCVVCEIFSPVIVNADFDRLIYVGWIEDGAKSCQPYCFLGREAACYIFSFARGSSND